VSLFSRLAGNPKRSPMERKHPLKRRSTTWSQSTQKYGSWTSTWKIWWRFPPER